MPAPVDVCGAAARHVMHADLTVSRACGHHSITCSNAKAMDLFLGATCTLGDADLSLVPCTGDLSRMPAGDGYQQVQSV